jgi:site-specific recombinase XerD
VRKFQEKTLGPTSMPKHEAQHKLADYIEEYTGRLTKQGRSIATFADLWKAFSAVKAGRWSKKTREEVTLTSLQLLLNKMAEDGYGETAVGRIRKRIKACLEYGIDEDLVSKNPARKLEMPTIRKKRYANAFSPWRRSARSSPRRRLASIWCCTF